MTDKTINTCLLCKLCNLITDNKYYMDKHITCPTHIKNLNGRDNKNYIKTVYKCPECSNHFELKKSLNNHLKNNCIVMKKDEFKILKNENSKLQEESKLTTTKMTSLTSELSVLKEKLVTTETKLIQTEQKLATLEVKYEDMTNDYIEQMKIHCKSADVNYRSALSLAKYLAKYYKDVPDLKQPILSAEKLNFNIQIIKDIIHNFKHDILDEYLGDLIIAEYKKSNHDEQSMWSSDSSRQTFMVKDNSWICDKKGVKVDSTVISHITKKVYDLLSMFQDNLHKFTTHKYNLNDYDDDDSINSDTNSCDSVDDFSDDDDVTTEYIIISKYLNKLSETELMQYSNYITQIKSDITTKKLNKNILNYIVPKFNIGNLTIKDKNKSQEND